MMKSFGPFVKWSLLGAAAALSVHCGGSGGGGGAGGSSSPSSGATTSSGSGKGGSGGKAECSVASDCGKDSECRAYHCSAGVCSSTDAAKGTTLSMQMAGDCKKATCDGKGQPTSVNDDSDIPDDGHDCTTDLCKDGVPSHTAVAAMTACTEGGGKFCDGADHCVGCLAPSDCPSGLCQQNTCVPGTCSDMAKNGGETDLDCGGPVCMPCADDKMCGANTDCMSQVCKGSFCATPTCGDMAKNGKETGVDCGGGMCPPCAPGQGCANMSDCDSGVCAGNPMKCQAPSCSDGVKNGGELDVDCGMVCNKKCGFGQACTQDSDCLGGSCDMGAMKCAASCADTVKNGAETDIDCGGGTCPACDVDKACSMPADCLSTMCEQMVCSQINECDPVIAEDHTGQANVVVNFAGQMYTPSCLRVSVGTKLTFNGSFPTHPMIGGEVKNHVEIPANSGPFIPLTNMGTTKDFTMSQAGTFGFYCIPHGQSGMVGAVFVQ
jgi:plastocyanin